jgi:CubicO group peptidase (beta-lactamase class C family)
VLLAAACGAPAAHPGRSPGIERYPGARDLYPLAEASRVKHGLPAVGLGIVHRGRIVGLGMAGERVAGSADWATLDHAFDVASCAKSVTATVAAILVERGRVRWDTTLAQGFPELRDAMHADYATVTLDQLLRHRSGLGHELNLNARWSGWHRRQSGRTPAEQRFAFATAALQRPPRSKPGSEAFYTSDAYVVAGSLLERAAGLEWEHLVRSHLFEPLGLPSMRYGFTVVDGVGAAVSGHEPGWFGRPRAAVDDPSEYGTRPFGAPAGFLYATVPDLLRYLDAHIQDANGRGRLLPRTAAERLHRAPGADAFALGWMSEARRDASGNAIEHSVFHGGYSGRSRANLWFVPETQWGTVIVTNDGRGDDAITADIFYALLREFELTGGENR